MMIKKNRNNQQNARLLNSLQETGRGLYGKELAALSANELHNVVGQVVTAYIAPRWSKSRKAYQTTRRAYYLSAEFLMGRMVFQNLYALNLLEPVRELLRAQGADLSLLEEVEDAALGNGGLGRLAACFLDSAATHDIPLDGYGIRYKDGLFKQSIENGFQKETADNWTALGDPWCIRREEDAVNVSFAGQTVRAVPYDMAVIGYNTQNVNTLRLWQSEALTEFDFTAFNDQHFDEAVREKNQAEEISRVLYPNDSTDEGRRLRLKQQYFFCSASLQDIIRRYHKTYGEGYGRFAEHCAIQLNDTHPTVSIPELIRLLGQDGVPFEEAFEIARKTFSYTNHTVMQEALEKWNRDLFSSVLPEVYEIILKINDRMLVEFTDLGMPETEMEAMRIVDDWQIHMARLAVYGSRYVNGVAKIHTEILKEDTLADWYKVYPERFQNKTNGITQRRWLGLCNPELAGMLTRLIGPGWVTDLTELKQLQARITPKVIRDFNAIKLEKKKQLSDYLLKHEGVFINPEFVFDIQVKRLHEYKRQLLNAFSIVDIYFRLKEGKIKNFTPTAFLFGAKAAPGYFRAKAVIKYINEIARMVNSDPEMDGLMKVLFVANYNCSYAEKLIPAADISEQISTAGTEASGTGNMKLMLNGAVTLGTLDGANIEIVEQAGAENNYIFGARVEEINEIRDIYDPKRIYKRSPRIRRVVDTLVDGTFDDGGTGMFHELYTSLLEGASWHRPDNYFLLYDLPSYVDTKLRAIRDYRYRSAFGRKCLLNAANAGIFSSDRTIKQYAEELWHIEACPVEE